jgi:hypothetical protein
MVELSITVNCVQVVLTIPMTYSEYVLRLHNGIQWEYLRTVKPERDGLLQWNQLKTLRMKSLTLTVQLVGSMDSSIQIVSLFNVCRLGM